MNLKYSLTRAFFVGFACAAGFGGMALLIGTNRIVHFDQAVIAVVRGWESVPLTNIMIFASWIGTGMPLIVIMLAIMALLYYGFGHRRELILFVGVVVGSALLNESLKLIFQRARPTLHRIIDANGYSFPSGHSMAAFSLYGIVAYLLWKHLGNTAGRVALLLASALVIAAIGISRIYVGVHYPSDVLGGYLASGCWLAAAIAAYERYGARAGSQIRAT